MGKTLGAAASGDRLDIYLLPAYYSSHFTPDILTNNHSVFFFFLISILTNQLSTQSAIITRITPRRAWGNRTRIK